MAILGSLLNMVTPAIIDRVAAALGINSALARTAINIALPAILAAFAKKAATPAGAGDLFRAVQSADTGLLGSLDSVLSGGNKDKFITSSSSMLNNLLGGGAAEGLINNIASKAGLGSSAAAMLVPLASQMALSGIAKTPGINNASDLASMLSSEVRNAGSAAAAAPAAAASSGMGMLRWLIPLVALALIGWYFLRPAPVPVQETAPAQQTTTTPEATPAAPAGAVVVDGVDVSKTLTDAFGTLTSTFGTVTDAASAQAALPKLQEVATSVDAASAVAAKFSAEQKTAVGALITAGLPAVKAAAEKALAAAGAGDVLKPVVDGIFAKIEAMAK